VTELIAGHAGLIIGVLAAGLLAGFAGGLFGIGGGVVTVPALYAAFRALGTDDGSSLKLAIGTSLAVIVITSARSLATHWKAGHVDHRVLKAWGPWIAFGAAIGGLAARFVSTEILVIVFAAGAAAIGWRRIAAKKPVLAQGPDLTLERIRIPIGVGTGFFSSLMGLGGGAVGVMAMTWSGRSMHQAIATASGFGIAVAVPGAIGFMISGTGQDGLPPFSLGFVNLPAFVAMAAMTALSAHWGAMLAHRLNAELLSRLFGGYILVSAAYLVLDTFG